MSEENVVVDVATPNPAEVEARKFGWVPQEEFMVIRINGVMQILSCVKAERLMASCERIWKN